MNKKFMSFVLAAVLAISLGSSSAFALTDLGHVGDGFVGNASSGGITIQMNENGDNVNNDMRSFAEQTKGNLVTVFGYAAGMMTYSANKTGIQFYDANGMRAAYSVAEGADGKLKYTLSQISLSSTDWDTVEACRSEYEKAIAKETDATKKQNLQDMGLLGYFLTKKLGISEKALKTVKTDDEGNILDANGDKVTDSKNAAMVYASWLTDGSYGGKDGVNAISWLNGGVNHSLTISLGGSEPQITLSENGKQRATYGSFNGETYMASEYKYNDAGFAVSVEQFTLEEKKSSGSSNGNATVKLEKSKTILHINSKGQQDYITNSDGERTGEYKYTNNGSLLSYSDKSTGNTTWYSAGVASYVTNKEGSMVSQYFYSNGIMQGIKNYNNGQVTSVTAYDNFGRRLGTVDGNVSFGYAKAAIQADLTGQDVTYNGKTITSDLAKTKVQSIDIYADYVGKYDSFLNKNKNVSFSALARRTYGYNTPIAQVSISEGKTSTTTTQSVAGDYNYIYDTSTKKWRLMTDSEKEEYLDKDGNLNAKGKKAFSKDKDKKDCEYYKKITVGEESVGDDKYVTLSATDKKWLEDHMGTGALGGTGNYINPSDPTKFFKALGVAGTGSKGDTNKNPSIANRLSSQYEATTPGYDAGLTVTCMAQGVAVKQVTTYLNKVNAGYEYHVIDPAVVGTVNRIETINGKQYVVLANAQVDIADGNGFQSADGEEIYVCIDDLSEEEIASLTPGSTFAAAGYIDTSADGHYAINNLYAHEISSSDVQNMVQSFSATLAGNAEYQANVQMNMATFAKAAADGKTYQDWKGGWQLLIEYGGGAPALF